MWNFSKFVDFYLLVLFIAARTTRQQTTTITQCYTILDPSPTPTLSPSTSATATPTIASTATTTTSLTSPTLSPLAPPRLPPTLAPPSSIQLKYSQYLEKQNPERRPQPGTSEYTYRQLVYDRNKKNINAHNSNVRNSYVKGLNKFADYDEAEFISIYARLVVPNRLANLKKPPTTKPPAPKTPTQLRTQPTSTQTTSQTVSGPASTSPSTSTSHNLSSIIIKNINIDTSASMAGQSFVYTIPPSISIDWSCKASPVINQGQCGVCYIISAVQPIYITLNIFNKKLLPLSIQEVLSCAPAVPNMNGCVGGYFDAVYNYIQKNGLGRAIMYPYDSKAIYQGNVSACNSALLDNTTYKAAKVKITSSVYITNGDCAALVQALKIRAISVSIAVDGFQFYESGIFTTGVSIPNHGVTLVGYDPVNLYKVKNSWGTTWGMAGYAYLSQETGVCDYAMYPVTGAETEPIGACCT